jgi:hypothetical protein
MKRMSCRRCPGVAVQALRWVLLLTPCLVSAQLPGSLQADPMDLHGLAVLSGSVLPSSVTPWSGASALRALENFSDRFAGESLEPMSEAITNLREDDVPMVDVRFLTRFEYYARPNEPLSFVEKLALVDPLGTLELSWQTGLSLAVFVQATLQREYQLPEVTSNLPGSLAGDPVALENNDVMAGYLLYSPGPFEIVFGRQPFSIGPSPLTSLVVSRSVPYLDALDVGLDLGRLHMTLLLSTLENRQASGDNAGYVTDPYSFGETVVLHNIHYFEYDFGFLRAGIGGQVIIIRPQNAFQIADFFPVFSWHNADIVPNNLTLTLDVSAVPVSGLELYAQCGFDDINASLFGSDSSIPTITAGLAGASWTSRWTHASLDAVIELGATHYLWGSFDNGEYLARAIDRVHVDGGNQWLPLNSPFGPGVVWLLARVAVSTPWDLDLTASMQLLSRNTLASLTDTYESSDTVANAPRELSFLASIEASYTPFRWLRATLEPSLHVEPARTWMELGIGAGTSLEAKGRLPSAKRHAQPTP